MPKEIKLDALEYLQTTTQGYLEYKNLHPDEIGKIMIDFAKIYHTEQLSLCGVVGVLPASKDEALSKRIMKEN